MKTFLALALLSTAAFAKPGDTLLTCTRTTFSDLNTIVITETETGVAVTETSDRGYVTKYERTSDDWAKKVIELSGWYGYTRTLSFEYGSWGIEHRDECGGGYGYAVCK